MGRLADVKALDGSNAALAHGQGRKRLRVGKLAEALVVTSGHHELGFSSVGAYAYECLGRSGGWLNESRRVAKRLGALPAIEAALRAGEVTWKMAELLGRHASADDEEILLAAARRSTVREMAALLADCEAARESAEEDEFGERMCTVVRQVDAETLWDCDVTRRIVDHLDGQETRDGWIESVLAEAVSTMQNAGVDPQIDSVADECAAWMGLRREATAAREHLEEVAEVACEATGRPMWGGLRLVEGDEGGLEEDEAPIPTDPQTIDAELRGLVAGLASADLWLGGSLALFQHLGGHELLGYANFDQYVRERLGLGRSATRQKMKLARDADRLPEVGDAIRSGRLAKEAANLVARVAGTGTVDAWIERAGKRTYKHLREEVDVVETRARMDGERGELAPPTDGEVAAFFAMESDALSGGLFERTMAAGRAGAEADGEADGEDDREDEGRGGVQMCDGALGEKAEVYRGPRDKRGRRELRLRVPEGVFVHFRMLEVAFQRSELRGTFLSYLCREFMRVWGPTLGESDKWEAIYRRDGYRCTSPACRRRDVTLHHLQYRSAGGGDEEENVSSLCAFCHLEGEHGGRLRVLPPASRPRWELGRRGLEPTLVVEGRELLAS